MNLRDLLTSYKELSPDDDALEKIAHILGFSLEFNEVADVASLPQHEETSKDTHKFDSDDEREIPETQL